MTHSSDPKMDIMTLSFGGSLEKEFQAHYTRETLTMSRWAFGLGWLMYLGFGYLDYLMFPGQYKLMWGIRLFWVTPQMAVAMAMTFFPFFQRYIQPIYFIFSLSSAWGIYAMMLMTPAPGSHRYYGGILLLLVYCFTLLRLRFLWATAVGLCISGSYWLTACVLMETPAEVLIPSSFFLGSVCVAGAVAAYYIEYYARLSFFRGWQLDRVNRDLEDKVADRTSEIRQVNTDLQAKNRALVLAEKKARESEDRYRELVDRLPDGICITREEVVVYCNAVVEQTLDLASDDIHNRRKQDIFKQVHLVPADVSAGGDTLKEEDGDPPLLYTMGNEAHRRFLEIRHFSTRYKGQPAVLHMIRDVTDIEQERREKERLQAELTSAEKMKAIALLTGGVAHDLNNILSGVVSYPDVLLYDMPRDDPMRAPLEVIRDSGRRASLIVADLLTVARGVASERTLVNVNDEVEAYLNSPEYRELIHHHDHVRVVSDLDTNLPGIKASAVHIRKVIMNLVGNAAEAIQESGTVEIRTRSAQLDDPVQGYDRVEPGPYILLQVTDDGPGIPEQDLKSIFEPFYSRKQMGRSGTGLGLTVVKHTVSDHEGYVHVGSSSAGTCFSLWFPAAEDVVSNPAAQAYDMADYAGHGESLLVVDDEPAQRTIACDILRRIGYQVEAVAGGEAAVEHVRKNGVDLLVLDMKMDPGISGLETYRRIVKEKPHARAVIASGFSEMEQVHEAQALGAGALVKKPYSMEGLGLAVRAELDRE